MTEIVSLFTDGGVVGRNPSALGGTWAFVAVSAADEPVVAEDGVVTPQGEGVPTISNNYTELKAAIMGFECLPDGWRGTFYTDSLITLRRMLEPATQDFLNIPAAMRDRCAHHRARVGPYRAVLLGGHPTKEDLKRGTRAKDGKPVAFWNKHCDETCTRLAKQFLLMRARVE